MLVNVSEVTEAQANAFQAAATRWQEIIVEDFGSSATVPFDFACPPVYTFRKDTVVDDITIAYAITPIDGVGRVLGSAGPVSHWCFLSIGGLLV